MKCLEAKELIQLYLDSELDARATLEVRSHLEPCSSCSALLDSLLTQDRLLRETARAESTESARLRASILESIRQQSPQTRVRWLPAPILRRVAVITGIAIVLAVILLRAGWPGASRSVYAAVAPDHADHCSIDMVAGAVMDINELDRLASVYGKMNSTPKLGMFGYSNPRGRICKV